MDLDFGALNDVNMGTGTMKSASRTGRNRMLQEAMYTTSHSHNFSGEPLRKRPVEFVKAKEVYDPSAMLKKKVDESIIQDEAKNENRDENRDENLDDQAALLLDEDLTRSMSQTTIAPKITDFKSEDEQVDIENEEEDTESLKSSESEENSDGDSNEDVSFFIDNTPEPTEHTAIDYQPNMVGPNTVHDSTLTIGNVQLHTAPSGDGSIATVLAATGHDELELLDEYDSDSSSDGAYADYINQINGQDSSSESDESDSISKQLHELTATPSSESPKVIEYGFLPEDYEFDVSQISVTNVRFGIKNQYYTKCMELTGSQDEPMWIDEDDIIDFVTERGVKEHRLESFLIYITNGLIKKSSDDEDDYENVYVSSDSESDVEAFAGKEPNMEDEGIDDLIAFSTSLTKFRDLPETSAVGTTGKGSRKQLDLERFAQYDLDGDLLDSLQEQYLIRRDSKRNKRKQHLDDMLEDGIRKYDLLLKYPYTLHIKDIKDEFEAFLHNPQRDDVSFPPLDPHGNKTLTKMGKCYNLKTATQGKGKRQYIKATKYKRTFKYLPDYNHINAILRQRPVFNRTDQKRPKEEYIATDGNATKDRSRQRNRPANNAYVPEGHIVGGMAPEIDHQNVGRQLLEKLGWVKGEGLGAHGNKGISEPLVATVKKTKTGLGKTKY